MSAFSTLPLKILNSSGDLKQLTSLEEELFANEGGLALVGAYPTVSDRYGGSITLTNTADDSAIGVYKDTFYTVPIGTHPGTSISSGSTTTTVRQMTDSAYEIPFTGVVPTLIVADSDGHLHDMDSASYNALAKRVNEIVQTQEGVGTFRLSATQPTSEYEKWIDTVFTDTLTNGSTDYHIWRKITINVDPEAYYPIKRTGSNSYQEMTASEVGEVGNGMIQQGFFLNGVGEYELRSDSDGAPTAYGTWEARGTALDTKNTVGPVQYTTIQYTSPQFSRQYTGQYLGTYTNLRYSTLFQNFVGVRQINYAGVRNYGSTFVGIRSFTATFAGVRPQGQQFVGERQFVGQRNYAGIRSYSDNFQVQYSGVRNYVGQFAGPQTFIGNRNFTGIRNFAGFRQVNYAGNFTGTNYTGFVGIRQVYYSGARQYAGTRIFIGRRYYTGTRYFIGVRFFEGSRYFTGYYTGARYFAGPRQYTGVRQFLGNFGGPDNFTAASFTGSRYFGSIFGPQLAFIGERQFLSSGAAYPVGNPLANQSFAGTRNYAGNRPGGAQQFGVSPVSPTQPSFTGYYDFTGSYLGTRGYEYFNPQYFNPAFVGFTTTTGFLSGPQAFQVNVGQPQATYFTDPGQFLGPATQTFAGTRVAYYSGQRLKPTAFNFTDTQPFLTADPALQTFVGVRNFAGPRGYSANFQVQYAGVRNYASQFLATTPQTFVGERTFAGVRAFANTFTGVRSSPVDFAGVRGYSTNFLGATPQTFAGTRAVLYTGYYSAQYTGQYTSNYTSQYSAQYTGDTVLATPGTIRTYTLYVRVSET